MIARNNIEAVVLLMATAAFFSGCSFDRTLIGLEKESQEIPSGPVEPVEQEDAASPCTKTIEVLEISESDGKIETELAQGPGGLQAMTTFVDAFSHVGIKVELAKLASPISSSTLMTRPYVTEIVYGDTKTVNLHCFSKDFGAECTVSGFDDDVSAEKKGSSDSELRLRKMVIREPGDFSTVTYTREKKTVACDSEEARKYSAGDSGRVGNVVFPVLWINRN